MTSVAPGDHPVPLYTPEWRQCKSCLSGNACGFTTGVGAVVKTAKVQAGDSVVVFGLGGIGLNVVQGARLVGAGPIGGSTQTPTARRGGDGSG